MSDAIRDAFDDLKTTIVGLANETTGEARDKLLELTTLGDRVAGELVAGRMTLAQAEEAKTNLALTARSALVNAGYAAQARALDAVLAGISTAFKIIVALA
jgi:hypothetical protein